MVQRWVSPIASLEKGRFAYAQGAGMVGIARRPCGASNAAQRPVVAQLPPGTKEEFCFGSVDRKNSTCSKATTMKNIDIDEH